MFHLEQERWMNDPWKVVVCSMLLNWTSIKQVGPMIDGFFTEFDGPLEILDARKAKTLAMFLKPLGLSAVRTKNLKNFSLDWILAEAGNTLDRRGSWVQWKEVASVVISTSDFGSDMIVGLDKGWKRAEGWGPMSRERLMRCRGVGKYAADCYSILVLGDLRVRPDNKDLKKRLKTLKAEARLGK